MDGAALIESTFEIFDTKARRVFTRREQGERWRIDDSESISATDAHSPTR